MPFQLLPYEQSSLLELIKTDNKVSKDKQMSHFSFSYPQSCSFLKKQKQMSLWLCAGPEQSYHSLCCSL